MTTGCDKSGFDQVNVVPFLFRQKVVDSEEGNAKYATVKCSSRKTVIYVTVSTLWNGKYSEVSRENQVPGSDFFLLFSHAWGCNTRRSRAVLSKGEAKGVNYLLYVALNAQQ